MGMDDNLIPPPNVLAHYSALVKYHPDLAILKGINLSLSLELLLSLSLSLSDSHNLQSCVDVDSISQYWSLGVYTWW
jgi:hypothetical protein